MELFASDFLYLELWYQTPTTLARDGFTKQMLPPRVSRRAAESVL